MNTTVSIIISVVNYKKESNIFPETVGFLFLGEAQTMLSRVGKAPRLSAGIIASVAATSGLLFGFDTAVINGALVFLRSQFALTDLLTEIAASSLLLGCLAGAAIAGIASDRLGRRKSLVAAALLFIASALTSAAARSLLQFCFSRLASGLAIGIASTLTPVYISEIAPHDRRGQLVSLNQLAIVIGILVAFFTNWQLSALGNQSWRWMFGVAAIPSVGFLAGLLFIPESPRWLIAHNFRSEGYRVLKMILGDTEASAELDAIESAGSEENANAAELLTPAMRMRTFVAISLAVLQQITGINTVLYYGSVLFTQHFQGGLAKSAIGANVAVGAVNLLCTGVAMLLIDRWGRRSLLLTSSAGMAIALTILSLGLHFSSTPSFVVFGSVLLYVAFFAVGLGPGVWVYIAEIFPTRLRGRATSLATTALWTACLAVTLTFLSIVEALGLSAAFLLYAGVSLLTFFFVWKWVPETREKPLEEIERVWEIHQ
jgi:sugar porter (SP) family MFS transporter